MFGSPLKSYSIRPHNDEMGGCDPEQAWDEVSAGHAVAAFEMPANSDADVRTALINSLARVYRPRPIEAGFPRAKILSRPHLERV
jgi:hypothetical protein